MTKELKKEPRIIIPGWTIPIIEAVAWLYLHIERAQLPVIAKHP
jgi:hypothetical protein